MVSLACLNSANIPSTSDKLPFGSNCVNGSLSTSGIKRRLTQAPNHHSEFHVQFPPLRL
jgi:hypothetical protein